MIGVGYGQIELYPKLVLSGAVVQRKHFWKTLLLNADLTQNTSLFFQLAAQCHNGICLVILFYI